MSSVFLCYRREDSGGFAGRIQDQLVRDLGADVLFMDVDNIPFGLNFVKVLRDEVAKCDVLLAVIGQNWLDSRDERGGRRLDNPNDFVRIEIETALKRDIPVVPILLDGVRVPKADDLPDELGELSLRNGIDVHLASFHSDVSRLIYGLKRQLNIDIKRRHEIGLLALSSAIGTGLLNIPFAVLLITWNGKPIDLAYLTLSTILSTGWGAAVGVRSLRHGILLAGAGASFVLFFLEAALLLIFWKYPPLDGYLVFIAWASALIAVWFGVSFYGTIWLYRKLRKAGLHPVWMTPA
jgi:TIR domain